MKFQNQLALGEGWPMATGLVVLWCHDLSPAVAGRGQLHCKHQRGSVAAELEVLGRDVLQQLADRFGFLPGPNSAVCGKTVRLVDVAFWFLLAVFAKDCLLVSIALHALHLGSGFSFQVC